MKKYILLLILIGNYAIAQKDTINIKRVEFNSEFSYKMLEANQDLRKINILLQEKKNGAIKNNSLIIGTSLISIFDSLIIISLELSLFLFNRVYAGSCG